METKAITNNFAQGMTNIPSDAICHDDTTAAEYNLIFRDGEHRPIQAPVSLFDNEERGTTKNVQLLYVHSFNDVKRYIFYNHTDGYIVWSFYDNVDNPKNLFTSFKTKLEEIKGITSIGNTVIISLSTANNESLYYFLWKQASSLLTSNYKYLGNKIPSPKVKMYLTSAEFGRLPFLVEKSAKYGSMIEFDVQDTNRILMKAPTGKEEDMKALLVGLYSECKNEISKKCGFCLPFMARYALKLFDGSYTYISIPQLMLPAIRRNMSFYKSDDNIEAHVHASTIVFKNEYDLSDWSDIVKDICIFVSKPTEIVDTSSVTVKDVSSIKCDAMTSKTPINSDGTVQDIQVTRYIENSSGDIINFFNIIPDEQIISSIIQSSVFYKIADIGIHSMSSYEPIAKYLKVNDLLNLTTLEQLEHDDYYSKCPLYSGNIFMYNKRLHLSNVKRGYCTELTDFTHYYGTITTITAYVYIKTSDGDYTIRCEEYYSYDIWDLYFYYPDPRAYKVVLKRNSDGKSKTLNLKPHPLLNGAYYLEKLPGAGNSFNTTDSTTASPYQYYKLEELQNEVWVSEVNNPFVFNASGVNTVGNGSIMGVVSNTTALSQGQFGQFPLICFTTDGIYALQTSSTGIYSAAHPISREICNNTKSIVATDHLVFFSSEKGLMMINGSQVACVSQNMSGKSFYPNSYESQAMTSQGVDIPPSLVDFLKESMIAYDYRDNLLWIFNPNYRICYIFSIDSGTFSLSRLKFNPYGVINDYPDTLIERESWKNSNQTYKTLSLLNRPNINDDSNRIDGFIFSRPMKLGDSLALKNPTDIRLIADLDKDTKIKIRLFASEDLKNWSQVKSLRGRGFKYFKYNLIFENMLPTDTISGIVSRWQYRYGNKLR